MKKIIFLLLAATLLFSGCAWWDNLKKESEEAYHNAKTEVDEKVNEVNQAVDSVNKAADSVNKAVGDVNQAAEDVSKAAGTSE